MFNVWLLCKEKSLAEKVQWESWIVKIKIPMTVERKYSGSSCSWRVQRRGLGTMTQTYTVRNLNLDNSLHHRKAFSSTSSLKIRWNYLERAASADEFTWKRACLLQHNFPRCLNPCVVGKLLRQIAFDRSRNSAFLLYCAFLPNRDSVCEREMERKKREKERANTERYWDYWVGTQTVHHGWTEYRSGHSWQLYNLRFSSLFEMKRDHRGCKPAW